MNLALNRVYKDNLDNVMKLASELSAGDVAKFEAAIARKNNDIVQANAILAEIIARHTAINEARVAEASVALAEAIEGKKNASLLLKRSRRYNGTK